MKILVDVKDSKANERVYLITIYDKSEKEDINEKKLSFILKEEGLL